MKKLFLFALFALMFAGCTEDEYTLFGKVIGTVTDATTGEPISMAPEGHIGGIPTKEICS